MRTLDPGNFKSLFNFDVTLKDEIEQVEFLQSYYVARLKMLRKDNPEMYITRELADAETFYKDMISATTCYHHSLMIKKKQNERNNQEGGGLSPSIQSE
jgi:hypothetical protein